MTNSTTHEVSWAQFSRLIATPSPARPALVRQMQAQRAEAYSPARDFYRGLRKSMVDGRRLGTDRSVLAAAAVNAHEKKRSTYQRLGATWLALLEGDLARGAWLDVRPARWQQSALTVKVSPLLGLEYPNDRREVVYVHFAAAPRLSPDLIRAALRVMQLVGDETARNASPVLIDLQRGQIHRPSPVEPDYDAMLAAEAAGLSFLMEQLAA